jgi:integrase
MPRHPKLRKKTVGASTYWFTKAGGDTYLGNVGRVKYGDAVRRFREHLLGLDRLNGRPGLTAGDLIELFLDWVGRHRSPATLATRSLYCRRFAARVADLPADRVRSVDLEAFLESLRDAGLDPQTRLHAETSVRHCWNWAARHPSPTPYLPPTFRPFSAVERTDVPSEPLTGDDLLRPAEVEALIDCAAIDPNQFRRHGLAATVARVGAAGLRRTSGFGDLLRCYYHTGARTGELAAVRVGDVLRATRQVVLGRHKRSRTQKAKTVRHMVLNAEAFGVFDRLCAGRGVEERVFVRDGGRPWTVRALSKRFARVKEIAAAVGRPVRPGLTVYDFRHLWVSDALMAGNDVPTVARMAGTGVAMVERVYGHFRTEHLQDAQARLDRKRKAAGG